MRRRLIWLLVVPLAAAACQCAHWLGYCLAEPDAAARTHLLAATGHGYLGRLPLLGGVAAALLLASLGVRAAAAARGTTGTASLARWPFALVPALAFAAQEHVERLVHAGGVPLHAYADRTFLAGLALQLPFGLAAWLLAHLLLAAAERLGVAVGRRARPRHRAAAPPRLPRASVPPPARRSPLAHEQAGRAPPRLETA